MVLNNQEPGPNETEEKKSECEAVETGTKKIKFRQIFWSVSFLKFFFSKNSLPGLRVISVAGEEGKVAEEGKCEEDAQIANKE